MKTYAVTDIGRKRQVNQDCVYITEEPVGNLPNLFVVADGMGGHNAGDLASKYAVSMLVQAIREDADYLPVKVIRHAIEYTNHMLIEKASEAEEYAGMGTTLVVATVVGQYAYVANVGDSRLYQIGEEITQVTLDHSLVQEMVQMGELAEEDARLHPDKNIITRAIGMQEMVEVDFFDLHIEEGDTLLMCSDGLTNMVADDEIHKTVFQEQPLESIAKALVDKANGNGGTDNIAVVLIRPLDEEVSI
ncbi:MAG: Stp1/IreP family PP2C-type Ser/Thr phosphatase [Lachnospiraceae bacterium]